MNQREYLVITRSFSLAVLAAVSERFPMIISSVSWMVDLSYPYRWSIIFHTSGKQAQPGSQTHKISCSTLRLEIQRIHASAYDADADYQGRTQERLLTGIRKNHPLHGLAITMNPLVNISKCFLQADANVVSLLLPVVSRGRSHVRMCPWNCYFCCQELISVLKAYHFYNL